MYSDKEAIERVKGSEIEFIRDMCAKSTKFDLSDNQLAWIHFYANKTDAGRKSIK